jgi:hypothetical protein
VLALGGCGDSNPDGHNGPLPGGTVSGPYSLQLAPGPSCTIPRETLTFPMQAAQAGTLPHPGVQIVSDGDPSSLELELMYTNFTLRGGFGTTGLGVLSSEGRRLWIRVIGTGAVTQTSDGHGEVTAGTMMGYMAVGGPNDDEDMAAVCNARDHTFTLRPR